MSFIKKIFSRITVTILLLLVEVVLFVMVLNWLVNYMHFISLICFVISILVVLAVVKNDKSSAFKIAWIIVVMAVPLIGGIIYLMFGTHRPVKKMSAKFDKSHNEVAAHLPQNDDVLSTVHEENERVQGTMRSIIKSCSYPVYKNTSTKYYPFGEQMYADMLRELKDAKEYIFMEYFIISESSSMWKGILEILEEKAAEGIDVRLMYDDIGSLGLFSAKELIKLKKACIKVIPFNPFVPAMAVKMNNRDHRKIMVIDGKTAFNGGINIADEYINEDKRLGIWKDTGLMLKGEGVQSFTLMFLETWNAFCRYNERINDFDHYKTTGVSVQTDGFVMPYADSPLDNDPLGEDVYVEILDQSEHYVTIFSPYLIISDKMVHAMQMASKRGVEVSIVMPGIPDKATIYRAGRSYYKNLLKEGVKIYEYTPGFLHAKCFISDDKLAVVGTINLDYRSLYLHFECATLLYKTQCIKNIKDDATKTLADSRTVTLAECKKGFFNELIDAVFRIFSPLM